MGLSAFHAVGDSMPLSLCVGIPQSSRSHVPWRDPISVLTLTNLADVFSLQQISRFLFQSCAIDPHFADRATKSIQWNSLRRRCSWTTSLLRRWMLPTVERGPPIG
jgi:hypothetical protein